MVEEKDVLSDADDIELAEKYSMTREAVYKRVGRRLGIINRHLISSPKWKKSREVLTQEGQEDDRIIALRGLKQAEKVEHTVTLEDKLRDIHDKRDKED